MSELSVGDVDVPYLEVTPAAGDTTGTLTVHRPDGTSVPLPVTPGPIAGDPPMRRLTADAITYDLPGRWVLSWVVIGTGVGADHVEVWVIAPPTAGGPVPLYTASDLTHFLQQGELNPDAVTVGRRVVSGWLRHATTLTVWPSPIPDDLFAWGLELAGLVYNNPELLSSDTTGGTSSTWDKARRAQILDDAAAAYNPNSGDDGGIEVVPVWCFDPPDRRFSRGYL